MRRLYYFALLPVVVAVLGVVLPRLSPIEPVAFLEHVQNESPIFAPNALLVQSRLLMKGDVQGPERLHCREEEGRYVVYTGLRDGWIVRVDLEKRSVERLVNTGGRPMDLAFSGEKLIVADSVRGLLSVDLVTRKIDILATESITGVPCKIVNSLVVASNGDIYFTDSSSRWFENETALDFLEARPSGRVLRYEPATNTVVTILRHLAFPRGIALSPREEFLIINEPHNFRTSRYWLKGWMAGEQQHLWYWPALPDGISFNGKDTFWIAFPAPRSSVLNYIVKSPWIRKLLGTLLRRWPSGLTQYNAMVIGMRADGDVTHILHDLEGTRVPSVTSVTECGHGRLLLGNRVGDWIGEYQLSTDIVEDEEDEEDEEDKEDKEDEEDNEDEEDEEE